MSSSRSWIGPPDQFQSLPACCRLAVDVKHQGQHLGRSLLMDAMTRVLQAGELIGIRALLVHAVDERARAWYTQFGFECSPTHPLHLILLLKDLRAIIEDPGREP